MNCSADTYTIGGTVNGLLGSGLTLRKNGTDILAIAGNGSFAFNTALAGGSSYIVAVAVQPTNPAQTCTVTDGFGTVTASNVTSVIVDCIVPNTSGSLDLSFDADGIALTDLSSVEDFGRAVVLQPDNKIVVVGYARTNGALYEFALARYDADGSLDTSFGNGTGMVTENFNGGDSRQCRNLCNQMARSWWQALHTTTSLSRGSTWMAAWMPISARAKRARSRRTSVLSTGAWPLPSIP